MGAWADSLKNNPLFWQGAFIFALIIIFLAHKLNMEATIKA